jgi:hypothetical protein
VRKALSLLSLLVCLTGLASGQTGTITGAVLDQVTQEPLPFANVQVLLTALGAAADENGRFIIPDVPIGTYEVRATLVGYQPATVTDVVVSAARPRDIVVRLDQITIGIGTVEVTAGYFQKSPDAVISTQRLSYEEIRRSPGGFEDVVRAISVLPGVAQAQPGRNDLVVRGGAPSENMYLVDNIEIPNINHFGTQGSGGGPLSYINLDFVRETSFSTGGFGVRHGDRLSSVLNVEMRDGRTDHVGGKATISATQFGLNLEGPIDQKSSFLFSARRSYLDFIFKLAKFSFIPEYWDFLAKASYSLDQKNSLSFLGIGAIDDVTYNNSTADDRYKNSQVLGTAQNQYVNGFSWQHLFGRGITTVTLGRTYVNYNGTQRDSLLNPIFTNKSKEGETSLRGDAVFKLDSEGITELSFGAIIKVVKFNTTVALPGYITPFGDTLDVRVNDLELRGSKGGMYVQVSRHLPAGFQLTAGGRMEYFSMIKRKFSFAPRASLIFEASPLTTLTVSAGIYHQSPSYVWLATNTGNQDLTPARVDQYILGAEHLVRADLRVRLEGFTKRYSKYAASVDRRYLVLSNTGAGYGGSDDGFSSFGFDNLASEGEGRSYGVELLVQKKLSEIPLYGLVSITWANSRFTALDGVERPGSFDQRFILNFSGGYRFDERWEASLKYRFATGMPYTPFNSDGTQNVAAYNSARMADGGILDLRVDRRWNFARWNLIVYVDLQNVLNNKNSGSVRWNARDRKIESEDAIGILPSLGVSGEF